MDGIRTHYLDASAIVKLLVDEEGSDSLRAYCGVHSNFYATSVCFVETLGVLKAKARRQQLTQEEYLAACEDLIARLRDGTLEIEDIGISQRQVFDEVEQLAKKQSLDISDAYQLVTLNRGALSRLKTGVQPILITADGGLACAARSEGLRAWDCLREPAS